MIAFPDIYYMHDIRQGRETSTIELQECKSYKQNTGIIVATLNKIHFVTYSNYAKAEIKQYRMLNSKWPYQTFLYIAKQTEKIDIF